MDCLLAADRWNELANRILDGHELTAEEGLNIIGIPKND